MNSTLIDVQKNGAICTLTINRPEALNALNQSVLSAFSDILDRLENDSGVRVVVLTGQGKAFVAGADIAEMKSLTPAEASDFATLGASVFRRLEVMDQTVIAAVNGFALGGGASWQWPLISGWLPRRRSSVNLKSVWGLYPDSPGPRDFLVLSVLPRLRK